MKLRILIIATLILSLPCFFSSCDTGTSVDNSSISTDSSIIAAGEASFRKNCSGCHNFRQDGIGPQLSGITTEISVDWIHGFISDSKKMIESGDERAVQMFNKYKKAVMPSFATLKDDEVNAIIAFLHTHKYSGQQGAKGKGGELSNPIPDTIALSNLVVNLEPVTQIPPSSDSAKMPLTRITKLTFQPNTGNLFINDLRGKLYKLQQNKPIVYMDMAKLKPKFFHESGLATGFGSFAFHPEFSKNGILYTTHAEAPGSGRADFGFPDSIEVSLQWVLTEWKTENPNASTFSGKSRELFRVNMVSDVHGVQEITFNPLSKPGDEDYGMLYIGVGDGGVVGEGYPFLTHSTEQIWGTILRIDPMARNSANGQYGIPKNNPFAQSQHTKILREIYAYGFRNPHRITWTNSGDMLACNIGQGNIESVNLVMPGHDYGWPIREGTFLSSDVNENLGKVYPLPANDSPYKITYPVAQYDHDEGLAISGGFEYRGKDIPELKGKYLFGDIAKGRLFYINIADIKQGGQAPIREWKIMLNGNFRTLKEICGSDRVDLHFGSDSRGELYILTKTDGKVHKLVSAAM
ncbi:MAG TPA: PQQ-dependent sugar dehydrogenase [Chitinophagaceae bacterium]|nr:PQQ-dependent sugar dehydrogenase [Chitinophagaceae bacterium]